MSILHVTDFYLPRLGGIEVQVRDLALNTAAAGYPVRVLTATEAGPAMTAHGVPEHPLDVTRVPGWWRSAPLRRDIDDLLDEASVVHCHSSLVSPLAWHVARRAAGRGVPVIATMHSMTQSIPGAGLAFSFVMRRLGTHGRNVHWTAVSSIAASVLESVVGDHVDVLPNAIDPHNWQAEPLEAPGPVTLVAVMRLAHRKRALPLMRVLAEVRQRVPAEIPLRAVIVGDGPQRAKVERLKTKLGLDWVELPGRLERHEVAQVLEHSHVFLAPATLESFGIAALEARCAGLPVVAMSVGGVQEFVRDGREGLLVDDDGEFAAAVTSLVTDPGLRAAIRQHNCTRDSGLDWANAVGRALQLYRTVGAELPTRRVVDLTRAPSDTLLDPQQAFTRGRLVG